MNVIAQTKSGDPNNVIFVGAHADSVEAGPGNCVLLVPLVFIQA